HGGIARGRDLEPLLAYALEIGAHTPADLELRARDTIALRRKHSRCRRRDQSSMNPSGCGPGTGGASHCGSQKMTARCEIQIHLFAVKVVAFMLTSQHSRVQTHSGTGPFAKGIQVVSIPSILFVAMPHENPFANPRDALTIAPCSVARLGCSTQHK